MLTSPGRSLFPFFTMPVAPRLLARYCYVAGLVYAVCLGGTVEAQQLRTGSSPRFDPKLNSLAITPSAAAVANYPLAQTFLLHSRPSATKRIYLDFDGHVTTGTGWNTANNAWPTDTPTITTAPWSLDVDPAFSNAELTFIQEVFDRVTECFSPFDVDVTTEAPLVADLLNTGAGDTRWGVRVCIGNVTPASPGGGWGFIGGFGMNSVSGNDTPCFVFNLSPAKVTADTCVHEAGHTLGLNHDGLLSPVTTYYTGHGSGPTGWAPHMGAAYSKELAQWSKGEYFSANNQEDDLIKITTQNGFGYRTDDYASAQATAGAIGGAPVTGGMFNVDQSGVIERQIDSDWFKISAGAGTITLNAVGGPMNTMLDIQMDLYNGAGVLVTSNNPATGVTASITRTVTAGTYYVKIDGVGNGDPLATGYTDYSSLGQYRITGSYNRNQAPPPPPVASNVKAVYNAGTGTLTLTGDSKPNTLTVTLSGGTLTVTGSQATKINNTASFSTSHAGKLVLAANLGDGDDSMTVVGVDSSTTDIKLGAGADKAVLNLCTVTTLKADGGTGIDTLITTTSTITTKTVKNIP